MHKDKFVFAQLTQFLDRNHFNYLVKSIVATSISRAIPVGISCLR